MGLPTGPWPAGWQGWRGARPRRWQRFGLHFCPDLGKSAGSLAGRLAPAPATGAGLLFLPVVMYQSTLSPGSGFRPGLGLPGHPAETAKIFALQPFHSFFLFKIFVLQTPFSGRFFLLALLPFADLTPSWNPPHVGPQFNSLRNFYHVGQGQGWRTRKGRPRQGVSVSRFVLYFGSFWQCF